MHKKILSEISWLWYHFRLKLLKIRDPRVHFKGLLSYSEGITLYKLAMRLPENAVVVEIGCYGGLSTAYITQAFQGKKGKVFSIDPFDSCTDIQERDETNDLADKKPALQAVKEKLTSFGITTVTLIQGFSYDVIKTWDKKIDLLWIDGNHEYEAVKRDYEEWEPWLKNGGYIAFHDANKKGTTPGWSKWGWEGPTKVVDGKFNANSNWKVVGRCDSIRIARKLNSYG